MRIKTKIPLTLSLISKLLNSPFISNTTINAITTDSRNCEENDLFIALSGEKFNGADFIDDAKRKKAFVISEHIGGDIVVENAYASLLKIAEYYKSRIALKYRIGITGSCGKTTVKDFTHFILSRYMQTHKTKENYNNNIGLSHTLLTLPTYTDAVICEMGMNHLGEISELSRTLNPNISAITNIGTAHIGNLGSRQKIAQAKLEIEDGMSDGKTIFFKEEPLLSKSKNPYTISFEDKNADMYIKILSRSDRGSILFVRTNAFEHFFTSKLYSLHTLNSLILAIAISINTGLSATEISESVRLINETNLRQKFLTVNGYKIYDDSYNSSPEAVVSALHMLSERSEPVCALIGDMLELGEESEKLHEYIGKECAKSQVTKIYAFGRFANSIARGALWGGINKKNIFVNTNIDQPSITATQIKETYQNERILVKASHAVKINRVIDVLKEGDE